MLFRDGRVGQFAYSTTMQALMGQWFSILCKTPKERVAGTYVWFQPPRSTDLNVLDLSVFIAIKSVQYRLPTYKADALIGAVLAAFEICLAER